MFVPAFGRWAVGSFAAALGVGVSARPWSLR